MWLSQKRDTETRYNLDLSSEHHVRSLIPNLVSTGSAITNACTCRTSRV